MASVTDCDQRFPVITEVIPVIKVICDSCESHAAIKQEKKRAQRLFLHMVLTPCVWPELLQQKSTRLKEGPTYTSST